MASYNVYYMKPEWFPTGIMGTKPDASKLTETHVLLRSVDTEDRPGALDRVYHIQQAEVWSPNGEARPLIMEKGLQHTSMSMGDVIEDTQSGELFVVSIAGFERID